MKKMNPKVFVGIITADSKRYAEDLFFLFLNRLNYESLEILIVDNSANKDYTKRLKEYGYEVIHIEPFKDLRQTLIESRNILRERFLASKAEYFFSLESDVLCEEDIIARLLDRGKDIVSGIYCYPTGAPIAFDYSYFSDDYRQRIRREVCKEGNIFPIKIAGLGCLLIKREVLEKIKFRFESPASGTDDVWFSLDALEQGYKIYLDTSVKCKHYGNYLGLKEVIEFDKY